MVNMGSVWDRTAEFVGENTRRLMPLALLGLFAPMAVWTSIAPVAHGAAPDQKLMLYTGSLVLAVWTSWAKLAISALALDPVVSTGEAAQIGIRRLLPYLLVSILIGVAVMLLGLPIIVALAMGGMDFAAMAAGGAPAMPSAGSLSFVVLYGLALLALLVVVLPRLVLVAPVVVAERLGFGAIRRSAALTKGYTLPVIGLVLLYAILAWVASLAAKLVFGTVFRLLFGDQGALSIAEVLTTIVVAVVTTIFSVLATAFVAKLYLALRGARDPDIESL